MTEDTLKELERLDKAANAGPWEHVGGGIQKSWSELFETNTASFADGELVAAMRNAFPALIAAARAGIAARTVKPLEWTESGILQATVLTGMYSVWARYPKPGWEWRYDGSGDLKEGITDEEASAKAACEADWQARIAPALLPSASLWIPCSERMPDHMDEVMLYCETSKSLFFGSRTIGVRSFEDRGGAIRHPSHWQPLPPPPQP